MAGFDRSIKLAYNKLSGELLEADKTFEKVKDGFKIRRQVNTDQVDLCCYECGQKLIVSTSKYDRLHFKHLPNSEYCILKEGNLSPAETEQFNKILYAKESQRHKELKHKIAQKLLAVNGVAPTSIAVDNKFIIKDDEKRRPDVYCQYYDKELVFEIQLADLSLRYILSRHDFYKKHGMYLIWILDNFDVRNQGQLERDIKYLTKYQNFFKLDESAEEFKLLCEYKFPFLAGENKLLTKWLTKSVSLDQVTFDTRNYQIYYYNFGDNNSKVEACQRENEARILEAEKKRLAGERLQSAVLKARKIIAEVKYLRERKAQNFDAIAMEIFGLDELEVSILNQELALKKKGKVPALHRWVKSANQDDVPFLEFILNCEEIELDIQEEDLEGYSVFQLIFLNANIYEYIPMKALMKRGYKLTDEDRRFYQSNYTYPSDKTRVDRARKFY